MKHKILNKVPSLSYFICSLAGIGYFPKAPGTFGSLASVVLAWALIHRIGFSFISFCALLLALLVLGIIASTQILKKNKSKDPSFIVIDESVGQWIALLPCYDLSFFWWIIALIGFRLFDIWKPGPIGWIDQRTTGSPLLRSFLVMADDMLAGIVTALLILGAYCLFGSN